MSGTHTNENAERFADVVVMLKAGPKRRKELLERIPVHAATMYCYLRALSDKGLIEKVGSVGDRSTFYRWIA